MVGIEAHMREHLNYNPSTGDFTWIKLNPKARSIKIGDIAGTNWNGYIGIGFKDKVWSAHRLAVLYMTGKDIPVGMVVDHINHIKSDNRWLNIRVGSSSQNCYNKPLRSSNKSGHIGVHWSNKRKVWNAKLMAGGKAVLDRTFHNLEDAIEARRLAVEKHHGEYAYRRLI